MKGPLYWLLVNSEEKPAGRRLRKAPTVWLFFIGIAIWGLACINVTQSQISEDDPFLIMLAVKLVGGLFVFSLPAVVITLRVADKVDHKCSFIQFIGAVIAGGICSCFLGLLLEVLLALLGIRHFLGIPIEKWS
jgi:hypothetical protein